MNVTFRLPTEDLEKTFVEEATAAGLDGLKGHRAVGGMRASLYNAFPEEGVDALVDFMKEFERRTRLSRRRQKYDKPFCFIALRQATPCYDGPACLEEGRFVLVSLLMCLVVSAAVTQVAVFGTTIYLHRTATHRALELHPAVAFVFQFALWLTTGLSTKEWVAVHRKHHAFTDEEGDPHSPQLLGFWSVQLGNVFLLHQGSEEDRRRRALRARHRRGLVGSHVVQARLARPDDRHRSCCA